MRILPAVVCCLPFLVAAVVVRPFAWTPPELPSMAGPGLDLRVQPPRVDGFDFPVGAPDAAGYLDAQPFGRNHHLGSDWNAVTGGATDLGDPVYVVAHGLVAYAGDLAGGWGRVVRVVHQTDAGLVETVYAHLDRIDVEAGQLLHRGDPVGTIGDAHGVYIPHLHFELRTQVGMDIGPGYAENTDGWTDPTAYINAHRPRAAPRSPDGRGAARTTPSPPPPTAR